MSKLLCAIVLILISLTTVKSEVDLVKLSKSLGLTTFVDLIYAAGDNPMLSFGVKGQFTMFAPTNQAFDNLPPGTLDMLRRNTSLLDSVIRYHVYMGSAWTWMFYNDEEEVSLLGDYYKIRLNIYHNGTGTDIYTMCGHPLIERNYNGTNGILHIIDKVNYPLPYGNIVGNVTVMEPRLKELARLINRTTLKDTINSDPVTFFAPTNDAFRKLSPSTLAFLLKNTTALEEVLKYHLVRGTFFSVGLGTVNTLKTVEGGHLTVASAMGHIAINKAGLTEVDITVSNGVVHYIDTVLFPARFSHV